jgi:TPR repeat protein
LPEWSPRFDQAPGQDLASCRQRSLGSPIACARVAAGDLASASTSLEADQAIANLRELCIRSSADACCALGDQYQSGKWVPADPAKATELRKRACELGRGRCCRPDPTAP